MNHWSHILTAVELEAHYALTASIDPAFAAKEQAFYESRTYDQLKALAAQAFDSNQATAYQLAKTYASFKGK